MSRTAGSVRLFAFDLDGTLYVGEEAVDGAAELIETVRQRHRVAFFTNNSSRTSREVHEKLNRLGIGCKPEEVYASSSAAAVYLVESGVNDVYVIGSESFRREVESHGIRVRDDDSAADLVVGMDRDFSYEKIAVALCVLGNGGRFVACNEDASFPVDADRHMPGCGAMVGAIAGAAGRRPDFVVGKPNTYILSGIADAYGVSADEIAVVGDSEESDIAMAREYGSLAILMDSGGRAANSDTLAMENLRALIRYVEEQ